MVDFEVLDHSFVVEAKLVFVTFVPEFADIYW